MRRNSSDILARRAFVDLVTRHVHPGSTLLDFGCGTGTDAQEYTQRGYRVLAYDHSPGMVAQLEQRGRDSIASGDLVISSVAYRSFMDRFPFQAKPHAVVSDFAVLNLLRDLEPLFETFARNLEPPGWMIVSIWNPTHWTKLITSPAWLPMVGQSARPPVYRTLPYMSYLHFQAAFLRAAHQFHLVRSVNASGLLRADSTSGWLQRLAGQTPLQKILGYFLFLVLRRDP